MRTLFASTATDRMVFMVDETDHVTGLAGLTLTITHSKAGGAFASMTVTVTDRGDGWYSLALTSTHTDTVGDLALHIEATGADPSDVLFQVVSAVRGLAGTALPNAAADAAGGLPISDAGGLDLDAKIGALTFGTANRVNAQVYGMEAGTVTAAAIATDAIDADSLAANAVTEIQSGLATATALATAQADLDTITGSDGATLATAQANYAPAKAGDQMDLVNAPNAVAVTAIQSGLATASALSTVGSDVITNGDVLALIAGAGFDTNTDSLEAIRTRGDAAWTTATGFSTHSAADVVTAMGTGTFLTEIPWNAAWDAQVESEVADALAAFSWSTTQVILTSAYDAAKTAASQTSVNTIDGVVDAIKVSTDRFETMIVLDGLVYQFTANALELAPTGGSAPSAADIRTEMDNNSTKLAAIVADTNELQTNQGNWVTATGFATPANVTDARDAILTQGNTAWTTATSVAVSDKTGFKLASDGLDSITLPDHTGPATGIVSGIKAILARFYNRVVRTPTQITTYRNDGTTVATTQSYTSADEDNDDVGVAT